MLVHSLELNARLCVNGIVMFDCLRLSYSESEVYTLWKYSGTKSNR